MMPSPITPLGIDNVFFAVADHAEAIRFYALCGLTLEFQIAERGIALLSIGEKTPGLMLRVGPPRPGHLWVAVRDAADVAVMLDSEGIETKRLETATGFIVEVCDPSGNILGFADYSKRPDLAAWR